MSRPTKPKRSLRSEQIMIRLTPGEARSWRAEAKRLGFESLSAWIRAQVAIAHRPAGAS